MSYLYKKIHTREKKKLGIYKISLLCRETPDAVIFSVKCNISGMVGISTFAKKNMTLHMQIKPMRCSPMPSLCFVSDIDQVTTHSKHLKLMSSYKATCVHIILILHRCMYLCNSLERYRICRVFWNLIFIAENKQMRAVTKKEKCLSLKSRKACFELLAILEN